MKILTIDFCYWQQDNYKEGDLETGIIKLIFNGLKEFNFIKYKINSDEIISASTDESGKLILKVYNDLNENCYEWIIIADNIEIIPEIR